VRILHETHEDRMGLDSEGIEGEGDTEDMDNDALARRARIAFDNSRNGELPGCVLEPHSSSFELFSESRSLFLGKQVQIRCAMYFAKPPCIHGLCFLGY
jgi:hypothetical protein